MTSKRELAIVVSALKHAAPYIRLFKGKVFVLKAGGEIFADRAATTALMEQVGILHQVGIRVVMIHGGGPQSTELAAALGVDTTFVDLAITVIVDAVVPGLGPPWPDGGVHVDAVRAAPLAHTPGRNRQRSPRRAYRRQKPLPHSPSVHQRPGPFPPSKKKTMDPSS